MLRGVCYPEGSVDVEGAVMCPACGCRATLKAWQSRAMVTEPEDLAQLLSRVRTGSIDAEVDIIEMFNERRKELVLARSALAASEAELVAVAIARLHEQDAAMSAGEAEFIANEDELMTRALLASGEPSRCPECGRCDEDQAPHTPPAYTYDDSQTGTRHTFPRPPLGGSQ
jgi:hypothetical protein